MKKKGFTLIELLAVIVILAIIALIATPLVLKYIEYSKEKSAKLSAQTYAEAVEKEYVSKLTSNEKIPNGTYNIEQLDNYGVKVKGDKPEGTDDYVVLNNGSVTEYELTIKGYVIKYKGGNTTVGSENDDASNNSELLDYTVKFMVNGKPYHIVSVTDGQTVNVPNENPSSDSGSFSRWLLNGENVVFPFKPTTNVEFDALFGSIVQPLYECFGLNQTEYGDVVIRYSPNGNSNKFYITVFFVKAGTYYIEGNYFKSSSPGYYQWGSATFTGDKPGNVNELISFIIENKDSGGVSNPSGIKLDVLIDSSYGEIYYTNTNLTSNIGVWEKIF